MVLEDQMDQHLLEARVSLVGLTDLVVQAALAVLVVLEVLVVLVDQRYPLNQASLEIPEVLVVLVAQVDQAVQADLVGQLVCWTWWT